MKDTFLTINTASTAQYKDKGSKFLAFAYPVLNEEEIKGKIEELKKTYFDARHYCYAYVLGHDGSRYRANDDGEPNHSAGDPILGQIRSKELTDILVVVVRYFGGTKLGVPGLIRAYKDATNDALENAEIIEKLVTQTIHLKFEYPAMNEIMRIIKTYELEIIHQQLDMRCEMSLGIRLKYLEEVKEKFLHIPGVLQIKLI